MMAVAMLVMLAGCGGEKEQTSGAAASGAGRGAGGAIEISFLTQQLSPTFDDYIKGLVAAFEAAHPGVKVKWLDYPYDGYETKIITSYMANQAPDVINLGSESIPEFAGRGYLLALNDQLPQETFDLYVPTMLRDGCMMGDKVLALPWYAASTLTLYNRTILEQAGIPEAEWPKSYDDLRVFSEKIRAKSSDFFGFFPIYTDGGSMRLWLIEAGIELYNADRTRAAFNTPEAVRVVKYWADLYKDKLVPSESLTAKHRRPIELYKTGRLAVFLSGPQFVNQIKADNPGIYEASVLGQRLNWTSHPNVAIVPLHVFGVSAQTKHPKLAAELAAFLTNDENQLAFSKIVTIFPSTRKALDDPFFTEADDSMEGRIRELSAAQIKGARILYAPPKNAKKMNQFMDRVTERICLGEVTVEAGLAQIEAEWNKLLAE